jgi:phosphatidylserine/phosphatidylglycerophosphate/cardiolipin synthase-like enzyme
MKEMHVSQLLGRLTLFFLTFFVSYLFSINTSFAFVGVSAETQAKSFVGFYHNSEGLPLIPFVKSAKKTLKIEIYQMKSPTFREAVREIIGRGVSVQIVQEPSPVGESCKIFSSVSSRDDGECREKKEWVQEVNASGNSYVPFNKAALCDAGGKQCLEHGKLVIVDEAQALISTGNFDTTNLCELKYDPRVCNRDYTIVTDDAVTVNALNQVFESDFQGHVYDLSELLTPEVRERMTVNPVSSNSLIEFIGTAKNTIRIQNQYLKDSKLNEALIRAAKKGIEVHVMVASVCAFGRPRESQINQVSRVYSEFDRVGIRSRFFPKMIRVNGKPGYLHAKAILVDGKRAWVGSTNGSTQASTMNREFGLFFNNSTWINKLKDIMIADQEDERGETWEESIECKNDY